MFESVDESFIPGRTKCVVSMINCIRCGVESSAGFVDSGFIVRGDWGGMCYAVGRPDWYPLVEGVLIASEFYVGR